MTKEHISGNLLAPISMTIIFKANMESCVIAGYIGGDE